MALRPQFSLIHSEFNDFLFAAVGEEGNGTTLTVLSALTRLGTDPWLEAARLSNLPKEAAARALAAAIAVLPEGDWKASDAFAIAVRLVNRLPRRGDAALRPPPDEGGAERKTSRAAVALICVALAAAALFAVSHLRADHLTGPAPSALSAVAQ